MMMDAVSNALSVIKNAEKVGKEGCVVSPASQLLGDVLKVIQKEKYIGDFEYVDNGKSGMYKIKLVGKINSCGAIKPRYSVGKDGYEKYVKRYLPAQGIGFLIISTPSGVMTQGEAMKRGTGGRAVAFVY